MATKESPLTKAIEAAVNLWLLELGNVDKEFLHIVEEAVDEGDWGSIVETFIDEELKMVYLEEFLGDTIQDVVDNLEVTVKFKNTAKFKKEVE